MGGFNSLGTSLTLHIYLLTLLQADSSSTPSTPANPSQEFTGDGTAYSEKVADGTGFACSYRFLNPWAQTYFAAINSEQWDDGRACGRCVSARCIDSRCTNKDPVTLMIVDKCPECAHGALDLSIPAYREMTGLWPHRLEISFSFIDCPADKFNGTIKMDPKDGTNPNWAAFYVSNTLYPLKSVILDGKKLERQTYNFWTLSGPLGSAPHTVELEADNGEKVSTQVDDVLKSLDLGVQF